MRAQKNGTVTNLDLLEEQLQFYRDHLDIFIEDAFAPIKLKDCQHIMARAIGRNIESVIVCSRGLGKTWIAALCAFAMCCLYPGTIVVVCSATAGQAALVFGKLKLLVEQNKNMANELVANNAKSIVQLSGDSGKCTFKNGSVMESHTLESMRGLRAKIIIIDEALEVDQDLLDSIVSPLKNYKRDISYNYNFKDYASKTITLTSACEKSNKFYDTFKRVIGDMANNMNSFACAFDYVAAIEDGITDAEYFEQEKAKLPASVFAMEYGTYFMGSSNKSIFPYSLTERCRTMNYVELEQPKNSKSRYVLSLDIATSKDKKADNAILSVIKFTEKSDGHFHKKLVKMSSYHGKSLDMLADIFRREYFLHFPNAERLIYDARGLGDSFDKFLDEPWIDSATGKEYPPLILDDSEHAFYSGANSQECSLPILHAVRAVQAINQRVAMTLRVAFEKRTIELPKNSRAIQAELSDAVNAPKLSMEEMAVFHETDALQFELGNIIMTVSPSGNCIYDTPSNTMHKDRYTSLGYACDYITLLEEENLKKRHRGPSCIGFASAF